GHVDDWNFKGLKDAVFTRFGVDINAEGVNPETLNRQELGDPIFAKIKDSYEAKERVIGPDAMRYHERMIMLSVLDSQWKDHLLSMDHLKEGIGLRGYGQHDPLVEYKKESFVLFQDMMDRIEDETIRYLFFLQITRESSPVLPFPTDEDEEEDGEDDAAEQEAERERQQRAAQASMQDFTRNIQRQKEKEMA